MKGIDYNHLWGMNTKLHGLPTHYTVVHSNGYAMGGVYCRNGKFNTLELLAIQKSTVP